MDRYEKLEQRITQLENDCRSNRRAWRIDYDELSGRLDNMGIANLDKIAKQVGNLKKEMRIIQNKYDKNNRTNK